MRVTISTKFGGGRGSVYFEVSVRVAQALRELGCIVYNPNTDNEKGDDGWLLSFNESLNAVKASKGFILQIQQGRQREKSMMQQAEEMNGVMWGVPKIGAYIPDDGEGGYDEPVLRADAWCAVECARRQWVLGVTDEVESAEDLEKSCGKGKGFLFKAYDKFA